MSQGTAPLDRERENNSSASTGDSTSMQTPVMSQGADPLAGGQENDSSASTSNSPSNQTPKLSSQINNPFAGDDINAVRVFGMLDTAMHKFQRAQDWKQCDDTAEFILKQVRAPLIYRARALTVLALRVGHPDSVSYAKKAIELLQEVKDDGLIVPERVWVRAHNVLRSAELHEQFGTPREDLEEEDDEDAFGEDQDEDEPAGEEEYDDDILGKEQDEDEGTADELEGEAQDTIAGPDEGEVDTMDELTKAVAAVLPGGRRQKKRAELPEGWLQAQSMQPPGAPVTPSISQQASDVSMQDVSSSSMPPTEEQAPILKPYTPMSVKKGGAFKEADSEDGGDEDSDMEDV